jgi:hypothetical protein
MKAASARGGVLALVALLAVAHPAPVRAQVPDTAAVVNPLTPGGAFLRSVLLPGWGHASIGAYARGGFYFAAETTAGFLLARTVRRLEIAKEGRDLKEDRLREALTLAGTTNPDSIGARLDADPEVARARRLVRSRRQQVEDWAALGLFMVFLSGADAFVSAHLRDFPEPIPLTLDVAPLPRRGFEVGLSLAVGPPPGAPGR